MKIAWLSAISITVIALAIIGTVPLASGGNGNCKQECVRIQDGTLLTTAGDVIPLGFDQWGYNYQAHLFSGGYCDAYRDADWCQPYKDTQLMMKWNEAWLGNMDCDLDGLLDRHYGLPSYIGSGAWLTNHMWGVNDDGTKWNYFVKIVAVPADAYTQDGNWYLADGTLIGEVIWGEFAIIQQVSNDPAADEHGLLFKGEAPAGFGFYQP